MEIKLPKVNSKRWLDRTPLEGEEWKPVPDYEGMYEVSNYGRVYSLVRRACSKIGVMKVVGGQMMRCVVNGYGYLVVTLNRNHRGYFVGIHILVGRAFIPNPQNLPQINHKDENKKNNLYTNLEWCDAKYNNNYGTKRLRASLVQKNDTDKSRPVLQYTKDNIFVAEYPSIAEAIRLVDSKSRGISRVCSRKPHCFTACGYKWKYKDDPTPIEDFPSPKLNIVVKKVGQFTLDGIYVASYKNAKEAERQTGILSCCILRCARGIRGAKHAGGFLWRFANE